MPFSIDCLHIPNLYGTAHSFCEGLVEGAKEIGVDARLYHLEDNLPDIVQQLRGDFTCSFGRIDLGAYDLPFFTGIPHWTYWLDPACYAHEKVISYADVFDSKQRQKPFIPHAVDPRDEQCLPKCYDVVFFGSYFPPGPITDAVRAVVEDHVPFSQMIEGMPREEIESFDRTCRAADRLRLLQQFPGAVIFGAGWPNGHLPVPWKEAIRIMAQAKVVLNSLPTHRHGTHERIFYALLNESVVLTNPNPYLEREFGRGNGIAFSIEELQDQDVHVGKRIVLERHTWRQRAERLVQEMQNWQNTTSSAF